MQSVFPFDQSVIPPELLPPPPEPPTLKLFGARVQAGPHSTLRLCFEAFVLPELDERSAATLAEYQITLAHWERLTDNPPVSSIDRQRIKEFRRALIETPFKRGRSKHTRSPATVNKIMRTLAAMISPLWPADRHNPGGHGFVPFLKWPESLPRQKKLPFTFSRKAMSQLYRACDACRAQGGYRKTGLYHPFLWRTAIVLALNTGPRTWDLFSLRWEDVRFEDFRYGSVYYRAQKTGKFQRPPLNAIARAHLERLRDLHLDAELVFPDFKKNKSFYAAWGRICAAAQVTAPFEAFRKTCSTLHDDVARGVGAWLTGHEVRGVNAENYQDPTRRVLRAVYSLKNPVEFRRAAKTLLAK